MNEQEFFVIVNKLQDDLQYQIVKEMEATIELADQEANVDEARAIVLNTEGSAFLAAKNDMSRKEAIPLDLRNIGYQSEISMLQDAKLALAKVKAVRQGIEARIGLIKAYLYSQAKVG